MAANMIYNKYEPEPETPLVCNLRHALEVAAGIPTPKPSKNWPGNTPHYVIHDGYWRKMFVVGGYGWGVGCENHQRLGTIIRVASPEEQRIWNAFFGKTQTKT
jgi:hypothetical protein